MIIVFNIPYTNVYRHMCFGLATNPNMIRLAVAMHRHTALIGMYARAAHERYAICVFMVFFFLLPKSVFATKIEIKTVSGTQWEVLMRRRIAIHWIFIFRIHGKCMRSRSILHLINFHSQISKPRWFIKVARRCTEYTECQLRSYIHLNHF